MVCHSFGCNAFNLFLQTFVTEDWKKLHVKSIAFLGPSFSGGAKMFDVAMTKNLGLFDDLIQPADGDRGWSMYVGGLSGSPEPAHVDGEICSLEWRVLHQQAPRRRKLLKTVNNHACWRTYKRMVIPHHADYILPPGVPSRVFYGIKRKQYGFFDFGKKGVKPVTYKKVYCENGYDLEQIATVRLFGGWVGEFSIGGSREPDFG